MKKLGTTPAARYFGVGIICGNFLENDFVEKIASAFKFQNFKICKNRMNPRIATVAFDFENIQVSVDFIAAKAENRYKITYDGYTLEFPGKIYVPCDSIGCSLVHRHQFAVAVNSIKENIPRLRHLIPKLGVWIVERFDFLERDCINFIKYGQYLAVAYDSDSEDDYGSDSE